jgi:hypothetical protein
MDERAMSDTDENGASDHVLTARMCRDCYTLVSRPRAQYCAAHRAQRQGHRHGPPRPRSRAKAAALALPLFEAEGHA